MAKSRTPPATAKVAAGAAVALAGAAAAAGGRLVHDRRARAVAEDRERAYRLRAGEYVPDGVRRIARGRLDDACERIDGASGRDAVDAVHATRKDLKRLRALVRLGRDALGEAAYDRENTAFRTAGRRLSPARDAQVLAEALEALTARFAGELPPGLADGLRTRLAEDRERAAAALGSDGAALALSLAALTDARARTAAWTLRDAGFAALEPGLARIYRRARKQIRKAERTPTTANLHEARKRTKDLWHALELVRPAAPKRLKRLAREAHRVAGLLGDDHDLAVLREYVVTHPQCFEDESGRQALLAVLDRRREALQRRAFKRARRLCEPSPKRFTGAIARGWRKRAAARPAPLAG